MERPIPYKGQDGYIFISYAHRDSAAVWPIIQRMQADGYRIWYDDGIDPGSEWDENIAAHVAGCGYFIAFLSANYLASNNCKDELNYSRDQGKPQLLIYLEDVQMPHGMAMRLGRNQAIFHNRYLDKEEFFGKLYDAQGIVDFCGNHQAPKLKKATQSSYPTPRQTAKKQRVWWPVAVALLLIAAAGAFFLRPETAPEDLPEPEPQVQEEPQPTEALKIATNVLLDDNAYLKVTAQGIELDSRYLTLNLTVENKAEAILYMTTENFYIDGVGCEMDWAGLLSSGEPTVVKLSWDRGLLESRGIDPEAVTVIAGELGGRYQDNSGELDRCPIAYYPYGEENVHYVTYTPAQTDVVLMDTEDFYVAAQGEYYDEEAGYWALELVCINRTQENLTFDMENIALNNYRMTGGAIENVYAGCTVYCTSDQNEMQWRTTDYDQVLSYSGNIRVYNAESYRNDEAKAYPFAYYPKGEEAAAVLAPRQVAEEDILMENQWIRVAYLGSRAYGNSKADLIYFCNLTDEFQEVDFSFANSEDPDSRISTCCYLEAGQESIYLSYRSSTAHEGSPPWILFAGVCDLEYGNFHTYDEVKVKLRDPDKT